jgi:hypothetical protein
MTTNTAMPRMVSIAPLIDQLQDIAYEELPAPRTCSVELWDDGDYDIIIYHKHGADETEAIYYDASTGEVVWKYVKNGSGWLMKTPTMVRGTGPRTCSPTRNPMNGRSPR